MLGGIGKFFKGIGDTATTMGKDYNALTGIGAGRVGSAKAAFEANTSQALRSNLAGSGAGMVAGGGYGAMSDDTSVLGGMALGAGLGAGVRATHGRNMARGGKYAQGMDSLKTGLSTLYQGAGDLTTGMFSKKTASSLN